MFCMYGVACGHSMVGRLADRSLLVCLCGINSVCLIVQVAHGTLKRQPVRIGVDRRLITAML